MKLKHRFVQLSKNDFLIQFLKYSVVGGIAAGVDISLFYTLTGMLSVNHLLSNIGSFTAGLLVNYFLSREWVFGQQQHHMSRDFTLFAIIGVLGLLLSNLILFVLIDCGLLQGLFPFAGSNVIKVAAKLTSVFIVLFWNFIARRKIVFHPARS
ncbi:MAG: GtrA family protein [Clostridia bacterium]|nr:GtrA family protein [Clostridia bacterium]